MKFRILPILALATLNAHAFEVTSADLHEGQALSQEQVFNGFGCHGQNISPQLSWHHPPQGTRSFAVTLYDPDAPTGSGWWHWTVFNLAASVAGLPKGAGTNGSSLLPSGATQGRTDFGAPGFGGACPPAGDTPHRYQLTVWALDTDHLPLDAQASGAMLGFMLHAHALGKATLNAHYAR